MKVFKIYIIKLIYLCNLLFLPHDVSCQDTIKAVLLNSSELDATDDINHEGFDRFVWKGLAYDLKINKAYLILKQNNRARRIEIPYSDEMESSDTTETKYSYKVVNITLDSFPNLLITWETQIVGTGMVSTFSGVKLIDCKHSLALLYLLKDVTREQLATSASKGEYSSCYCKRKILVKNNSLELGKLICGGSKGKATSKKENIMKLSLVKEIINTPEIFLQAEGKYLLSNNRYIRK